MDETKCGPPQELSEVGLAPDYGFPKAALSTGMSTQTKVPSRFYFIF